MATDLTEAATQAVTGQPSTPAVDARKRRFLLVATGVVGGIGIAASAVPFVMSFFPSERAKAAGAPVEVDIAKLEPGQKIDVEWRGKVVWLINRTPDMLASLPKLEGTAPRPQVRSSATTSVREEPDPIDQASHLRRGRHLHAPRMLADVPARRRSRGPGPRLARWLLLPLSPVEVRPRRAHLQGHAGTLEPGHSPASLPLRHEDRDRRRREGVTQAQGSKRR